MLQGASVFAAVSDYSSCIASHSEVTAFLDQEAREMRLPNSRLLLRYSTQYYKFAVGSENLIRPDHEVAPTWEDFKAGRDPVLDWVLQYKPKQ